MRRAVLFGWTRLMRKLDFPGIERLSRVLGFVMWTFLYKRRRASIARVALHLDCSPKEATALAKASFYNLAQSFLEIFLNDKFCAEYIHVENPELLQQMMVEGQPALFISAHFGSWELMGTFLSRLAQRQTMSVARKQKDSVISELIRELRWESNLVAVDHRNAAKLMLECLRNKGAVGLLADHNTNRREAIFLPFFNDIAAVNMGPAVLAVRARAIIYPAFMRRDGRKAYTLRIHTPLDTTTLQGTPAEKTRAVAEFYTQAIEAEVRSLPEQWLWMHDRWKTRPPA